MTRPYEWNPMPHELSVICPDCGKCATFHFAEARLIGRNADKPYFEASKDFEVIKVFQNGWRSLALYYHGLGLTGLGVMDDLPEGYAASDWKHSKYWIRSGSGGRGAIACGACGARRKHRLDWPADAFFQIAFRGRVLWAFDRATLLSLIDYVEASDRKPVRRRGRQGFLMKVPTHFLVAKSRDRVAKKLRDRLRMA